MSTGQKLGTSRAPSGLVEPLKQTETFHLAENGTYRNGGLLMNQLLATLSAYQCLIFVDSVVKHYLWCPDLVEGIVLLKFKIIKIS